LTLASFAVTKLAYVRLTKQFREMYLQRTGVDVRFRLTFAGSGVQVGAESLISVLVVRLYLSGQIQTVYLATAVTLSARSRRAISQHVSFRTPDACQAPTSP
jgi:ABC-type sulfate transport system substrate-binding protein